MKINWKYFTKQRGIIVIGLSICLVILGSANYIYSQKNKGDLNLPTKTPDSQVSQPTEEPSEGVDNPNDNKGDGNTPVSGQSDYFEAYRTNRQTIRDMQMKYVETINSNTNSDADLKKSASERLVEITNLMELELKIEGLVKAKGFEDVVAFVEDGTVNIVVKAEKLSSQQAAKIMKIASDETKESAQNITIIPRK